MRDRVLVEEQTRSGKCIRQDHFSKVRELLVR
jgi:hypothetical protein